MKGICNHSTTPSSTQTARSTGRARGRGFHPRLAFISTVIFAFVAVAAPSTSEARDSAARKLGRGTANLTLGVLALPGEIVQTTRERGPFVGATWGFVKGVGMTVAHEVVGLWEVLTCPFETPPDFKPILAPEFPWGYFYEGSR